MTPDIECNPVVRPRSHVLAIAPAFLILLLVSTALLAQEDSSFFDSFARNIGRSTFAIAWPSGIYQGARFIGSGSADGVVYATVRLYGKSSVDGSDLRTDCIITFKGLTVTNVRFSQSNGEIPPGVTNGISGQVLRVLQKGANDAQQHDTQVWTVTDKCADREGFYVRFFDSKNDRVWPSGKGLYHVARDQTRNFFLPVKEGQTVCYGARPDLSARRSWGVGLEGSDRCDSCCHDGPDPDISINLTCD